MDEAPFHVGMAATLQEVGMYLMIIMIEKC